MTSVELWFDDSDDEDSSNLEMARKRRRLRDASNILEFEENMFVKMFRLSKAAFVDLLSQIEDKFKPIEKTSSIPNAIKLATTLRFCAQGSYQMGVGNEYSLGLAQSTVSLVLKEVLEILETFICARYITFNYSEAEKRRAKRYFFEKSGIPGVIGCIDGTHVKIVAPTKDIQHLYYNRKGFFSLNAMVVCDDTMQIRFINAKYPGSSHDSMVFNMSSLKAKLEAEINSGERDTWLLGDAGYALRPYLMTPFRNPAVGSTESTYNTRHAQARNIVERTIGVLKNRFRCLLGARALHYTPKKVTQIINVCAALHNICTVFNVPVPEDYIEESEVEDRSSNENIIDDELSSRAEAELIRNRILRSL